MPSSDRIPGPLYTEIRIVCDMMLKTHYYEEANWLWMAVGSRAACGSRSAQKALESAEKVSREFGFPNVAKWVRTDVLTD